MQPPPNAPPPEALPPPPPPLPLVRTSSPAPAPRNDDVAANNFRLRDLAWLSVQTAAYFTMPQDDDVRLRWCLFCGLATRSAPVDMATHIVRDCRLADFEAKHALCTGDADRFTTSDGTDTSAKAPPRLALVPGDRSALADPFGRDQASSRAANQLFQASRDANAQNEPHNTSEDEVVDTGDSTSCSKGERPAKERAVLAFASPHNGKENLSPVARNTDNTSTSTAKKRRLEDSRRHSAKKRMLNVHESSRKRLFDDSPMRNATVDAPALPSPSLSLLPPPRPPVAPHSPPVVAQAADDSRTVVRDLTLACIAENVRVSFLSSAEFTNAIKRCCALPESANFHELSTAAVDEFGQQVDELTTSMQLLSGPLTFCVGRASSLEPGRAVVYLVDEHARSQLLSCQRRCHRITSKRERTAWYDELRGQFETVADWSGRSLHLCVADYSTEIRAELTDVFAQSRTPPLLVSGCMLQDLNRLREIALPMLGGVPDIVQSCVELALLVNEAERLRSEELAASPLQLSVPVPHSDQLVDYAVLLKQVLCWKHELAARYQRSPVASHSRSPRLSAILRRAQDILNTFHDQWAMVADTLQLLLPLAAVELLKVRITTSSVKVTSGVFVCFEMWLSATLSRSPLLSRTDTSRWSLAFLRRQRHSRQPHQLAVLLLDPRLAGVGLSVSGRCAARACVATVAQQAFPSLNPSLLTSQVADFENRTGAFASPELWLDETTADPTVFWRRIESARELQQVALRMCSFSPASPAVGSQAIPPFMDSEFFHAARVAQIRHLFQTREDFRVPDRVSSRDAAELFTFLTGDNDERVGLTRMLLGLEQFAWKPTWDDDSTPPTQQSVLIASQVYVTPLTATVDAAVKKHHDTKASALTSPTPASKSPHPHISLSWIDTSAASRQAMQRALSRVCAPTADADSVATVVLPPDTDSRDTVGSKR